MPEGPDNTLRWQNLNLGQLISYLIPILGAAICFALAYYLDGKTHFGHDLPKFERIEIGSKNYSGVDYNYKVRSLRSGSVA